MPPSRAAPQLAQVATAFRALHLGDPLALSELEGGSSGSFRVDLAGGTSVVLKTYHDVIAKLPEREVYAARFLAGLDLPITRYLAVDESRTRLPHRFAVTNYLPGSSVGAFRDEPDIADLHRQMGGLLRRLHAIRLPAFGHFDAHGIIDPETDHASYMRKVAAHAFGQFRRYGADPELADRLETCVAARAAIFTHSSGAVFAHDDLNPNNVLAQRGADGRLQLTGLIDFGNARAADAVFDLAKTIFICEHEAPGSGTAILEGYGPIGHPHPEAALWLYTLLHRVVMWWWLRHVGIIAEGQPHPLIEDLREMSETA